MLSGMPSLSSTKTRRPKTMRRMNNMRIRLVRFRPYRKGEGPTFSLELYEVPGQSERIGYTLRQHGNRKAAVIFDGRDFRPSPVHAWDSDETVTAIMGFLT